MPCCELEAYHWCSSMLLLQWLHCISWLCVHPLCIFLYISHLNLLFLAIGWNSFVHQSMKSAHICSLQKNIPHQLTTSLLASSSCFVYCPCLFRMPAVYIFLFVIDIFLFNNDFQRFLNINLPEGRELAK